MNVTPQEVKRALENISSDDEDHNSATTEDSKKKAEKIKKNSLKNTEKAKKAINKGIDRLEDNPESSAFALAGILTAVIGTIGFVHQRKPGVAPITVQQYAIATAGIALVSGGYYYLLKAASEQNKK